VDQFRIQGDDPLLDELRAVWEQHLLSAVADLPRVAFEVTAPEKP
jgi:hypothetical protein